MRRVLLQYGTTVPRLWTRANSANGHGCAVKHGNLTGQVFRRYRNSGAIVGRSFSAAVSARTGGADGSDSSGKALLQIAGAATLASVCYVLSPENSENDAPEEAESMVEAQKGGGAEVKGGEDIELEKKGQENRKRIRNILRRKTSASLKIGGRYVCGSVVGQGSYGLVRTAKDTQDNDSPCVIKEIDVALTSSSRVDTEINILMSIGNHTGLCTLRDASEEDGHRFLVFDFVSGDTLLDYVRANGPFDEVTASKLVRELLHAVKHLHDQGIIHRDIKPANLIYRENRDQGENKSDLVLIDFGMACQVKRPTDNVRPGESDGTYAFWSPEMMKREKYSSKVDLWSVGVTLYIMLCGLHPFDPEGKRSDKELYQAVISRNISKNNIWKKELSVPAKAFLKALLNTDPNQRPTCSEALDHEWFKEIDEMVAGEE